MLSCLVSESGCILAKKQWERVRESIEVNRCLPGGRMVPCRCPAQGQAGPGVGMLSCYIASFAIVRVLHMHPTRYN